VSAITRALATIEVSSGSITSFRASDVDFRFTLNTGRFSASQRTVETGQKLTRALHNAALIREVCGAPDEFQRLRKFRQLLCCLAHMLDDELCGRA
jgi:hypothetical protein